MRVLIWSLVFLIVAVILFLFIPATPQPSTYQGPIPFDTSGSVLPARYDCEGVSFFVSQKNQPKGGAMDVAASMNMISEATGLSFHKVADPGVADLEFSWVRSMPPDKSSVAEPTGLTVRSTSSRSGFRFFMPPSNEITKSKVMVLASPPPDTTFAPSGQSGMRAFVDHELGHAMGLNHPLGKTRSVMVPVLSKDSPARFTNLDLEALAALYGDCKNI